MKFTKGKIDLGYFWSTNFWTFGFQDPPPLSAKLRPSPVSWCLGVGVDYPQIITAALLLKVGRRRRHRHRMNTQPQATPSRRTRTHRPRHRAVQEPWISSRAPRRVLRLRIPLCRFPRLRRSTPPSPSPYPSPKKRHPHRTRPYRCQPPLQRPQHMPRERRRLMRSPQRSPSLTRRLHPLPRPYPLGCSPRQAVMDGGRDRSSRRSACRSCRPLG